MASPLIEPLTLWNAHWFAHLKTTRESKEEANVGASCSGDRISPHQRILPAVGSWRSHNDWIDPST
jgi:hypothetical protein